MDRRLNGRNSLSYLGVNAPTPPNLVILQRAPTNRDYINFMLGDLWLNNEIVKTNPGQTPKTHDLWMLVDAARNIGTWVHFGSGDMNSLTGDTGGAVLSDDAGNINILSGVPNVSVDGNPATYTLTINSDSGNSYLESLTGTDATAVYGNNAGNITLTSTTGGVTITNSAPNTLSFDLVGGGSAIETVIADQGTPTSADAFGDITFTGTPGRMVTTGDAGTHIVNWDIGETVPNNFSTNTDDSIPVSNNLSIVGGANITTSSDGSNVITINAIALGATQFDADTGSAYPENGIIKILGSGDVTTSAAGNIITISYNGGGGHPTLLKTTVYTSDDTWVKDPAATRVVVYIWSGGGGGGYGFVLGLKSVGGGGGGSGSLRVYEGPATASEAIVVGLGGAGAGPVILDGQNGGVSSFGAISGYLVNNGGTSGSNPGGLGNLVRGTGGAGWSGGNGGSGAYGNAGGPYATIPAESGTDLPYSNYGTGGGGGGCRWSGQGALPGQRGGNSINGTHLGGVGSNGAPAGNGTNGFIGSNYSIGGTGGGGGSLDSSTDYVGGNGGFPSGGGGGSSYQGTQAGKGGDGAVVVLEYDF